MSTSAEPAAGVTPAQPGSPATSAVSPPLVPAASSDPASTDQGSGNDQTARLTAEVAAWRKKHSALEKQLGEHQAKNLSEAEQAVLKAKEEGATEWRAKYQQALVENQALTVLSGKGVTATGLALKGLDLSGVDIDPATGTVDAAALTAAVDKLLTDYPMLLGQPNAPGVPSINGGSQQRVTSNQLAQVGDRDKLNEQLRWALKG